MIEIRFRGFHPCDGPDTIVVDGEKVKGEWVEGSLIHRTSYYGEPCDDYFIVTGGEFDSDYYDAEKVLPSTVGQYSGLDDSDNSETNQTIMNGQAAYNAVLSQMHLEVAIIAANKVLNLGPTRVLAFEKAFRETLRDVTDMTVQDGKTDKQLWYMKAKLDERLKQIYGEHFRPWEERYK